MPDSDTKPDRGAVFTAAATVGLLVFMLRIGLFRVMDQPIDFVETLIVTAAVVITVLVLQLRTKRTSE